MQHHEKKKKYTFSDVDDVMPKSQELKSIKTVSYVSPISRIIDLLLLLTVPIYKNRIAEHWDRKSI